uniref:Uncharacterized protein n=1 Tax=Chromera velia CCMP2878 TaxID=1169474 RepID=A0A0G4I0S7_9ALVE|eukprot:Cvel_10017.t1-p1 / transcript=Cvel_10017.t1 / gene=Cvel_10017 / organism=Chromera_velia_CCMP2878 / gene_product=Putative ankyrin repeat protein RF_0381, putative / transcript_product=Putative ankyrin repeat protein RF_0381, putative / location=Cvel_scaffold594:47373-48821(-) / protein_length=483 / sequence_SO=supercontig / SO=protein_coding / is_pseudo=false
MASPPTTEAFIEQLEALQASFFSSLQTSFQGIQLVGKLLREKKAEQGNAAAAVPVSPVRPEDVASLESLEKICKEFFSNTAVKNFFRKVRGHIGEITSRHFDIDLSDFFDGGLGAVGEIIRSFRAVTAKDFQVEFQGFLNCDNDGEDTRLFLKAGADVNGLVEGQTAMMQSISAANMDALQMILEDGANMEVKAGTLPPAPPGGRDLHRGDTAVIVACRQRKWGMVRYLIAEGASTQVKDSTGRKLFAIACEAADRELVAGGHSYLDLQSDRGKVLEELYRNYSDRNSGVATVSGLLPVSQTALHFFSRHGCIDLVALALSSGIEVNAMDQIESTALHEAAKNRSEQGVELVQFLIDNGADVNSRDRDFDTPLTDALNSVSDDGVSISVVQRVVQILVDHGADVDIRGLGGQTALHHAVALGAIEIVKLLLDRGADLQIRNNGGETPRAVALEVTDEQFQEEMLALLDSTAAARQSMPVMAGT